MLPDIYVRKELRKLVTKYAWEIIQTCENETIFTRGKYKITISAFDCNWDYIAIYDEDVSENNLNKKIRYIIINNISYLGHYNDIEMTHALKGVSELADEFCFTIYIDMDKNYNDSEDFLMKLTDFNNRDYSLIIKDKRPYCVRFHKNEKYTYMDIPNEIKDLAYGIADEILLFTKNDAHNYIYDRACEEIKNILVSETKNLKNVLLIEAYFYSLYQYLLKQFEEMDIKTDELYTASTIVSNIHSSTIYKLFR